MEFANEVELKGQDENESWRHALACRRESLRVGVNRPLAFVNERYLGPVREKLNQQRNGGSGSVQRDRRSPNVRAENSSAAGAFHGFPKSNGVASRAGRTQRVRWHHTPPRTGLLDSNDRSHLIAFLVAKAFGLTGLYLWSPAHSLPPSLQLTET